MVWIPSASADNKKITAIKQGQQAPFAGVLYSHTAHALLVARTKSENERYKLRCDLQLGRLRVSLDSKLKLKQIALETERKSHQGTQRLAKQQKDLLLNELKRVKKTVWYKSPVFMFVTGVVVTVGLTVLAVYAVDQIQK